MNYFKCDNCGTDTMVNPPTRPIFDELENEDGEIIKKPRIAMMQRQDPSTGDMIEVPVQVLEDLKPRAFIIQLRVGWETIQKDFCKTCLDELKPEIRKLWERLESIKSQ